MNDLGTLSGRTLRRDPPGTAGCTGVLVDSLAEEPASKRPGEFASGGGSWSADRHVCLYGCPLLVVCGASVAGYYCPVSVFCRPVSSSQFPLLAAAGPVSPDCAEPDEKHHPVHCKICLAHGRDRCTAADLCYDLRTFCSLDLTSGSCFRILVHYLFVSVFHL